MAKATGEITSTKKKTAVGVGIGDTVTVELGRGMKVIGKREMCRYFCKQSTYYTSCSLNADGRYHLVDKIYCPCHNWKARKK